MWKMYKIIYKAAIESMFKTKSSGDIHLSLVLIWDFYFLLSTVKQSMSRDFNPDVKKI